MIQTLTITFVTLFISLMLCMFTIFIISNQSAIAQPQIDSRNATIDTRDWLTYENDTLGIKLQYPSNWKKIVDDKTTIRFSPLLKNKTASPPVVFFIQALSSQNMPLEDLVSLDLIKRRQNSTDFSLLILVRSGLQTILDIKLYIATRKDQISLFPRSFGQ